MTLSLMATGVECSPMVQETGSESHFKSYQRLSRFTQYLHQGLDAAQGQFFKGGLILEFFLTLAGCLNQG